MRNLIKGIALVVLVFTAFSCSQEEEKVNFKTTSIAKIAEITPEFSKFNEALEVTGLKSTFEDAGNYTVFVPNDDAFAAVLGGLTVEDFNTANPGLLETVLKYHVIANAGVLSKDLTNNQTVATLQGQNITVTLAPNDFYPAYDEVLFDFEETSIFINSARVFARDVKCTNGIIHVIDSVLLPSS
jgi:uncharacterized surface protein with fasciclin (FAS1) repeats